MTNALKKMDFEPAVLISSHNRATTSTSHNRGAWRRRAWRRRARERDGDARHHGALAPRGFRGPAEKAASPPVGDSRRLGGDDEDSKASRVRARPPGRIASRRARARPRLGREDGRIARSHRRDLARGVRGRRGGRRRRHGRHQQAHRRVRHRPRHRARRRAVQRRRARHARPRVRRHQPRSDAVPAGGRATGGTRGGHPLPGLRRRRRANRRGVPRHRLEIRVRRFRGRGGAPGAPMARTPIGSRTRWRGRRG